jgi:selenoprotein W-related protein
VDAELRHGPAGSFEISVNGKVVSQRGRLGFPSEPEIVTAVRQEMDRSAAPA